MERVLAAFLALVFWSVAVIAAPISLEGVSISGSGPDSGFQQLDAEVERVLNEVVLLGAEMAILEESRELSPKNQLLVLVSVNSSPFFRLEAVEFKIDDRTVSYYQYSEKELKALAQGGSQRLFWDDIPPGTHRLSMIVFGRIPKDPDFQREAKQIIITGTGRRVVELSVGSGNKQAFPEVSIREHK